MTAQETIQRQVEDMYERKERRDYEREHGLEPHLFVDVPDPRLVVQRTKIPVPKRLPKYESFTVDVNEIIEGRIHPRRITVLCRDRELSGWLALSFFPDKNLCTTK